MQRGVAKPGKKSGNFKTTGNRASNSQAGNKEPNSQTVTTKPQVTTGPAVTKQPSVVKTGKDSNDVESRKDTPNLGVKRKSPSKWQTIESKIKGQKSPDKMKNVTMQMIEPKKEEMSVAQKWRLPVLRNNSGGNVRPDSIFLNNKLFGGTRRLSDTRISADNSHTFSILTDIAMSKKRRMEQDVRDKLNEINARVQKALQSSGYDDVEDTVGNKKNAGQLTALSQEARAKREKIDERRSIMMGINDYVGDCQERYGVIEQVNNWIHFQQGELEKELKPDENYRIAIQEADVNYDDITDGLYSYNETTEKLTNLSQILLQSVRKIFERKEKHVAPKIVVLDDHAVLSSKVKWDTAVGIITNLLDEATKWVKGIPLKTSLKNGKKQFNFIMKAVDKRLADLTSAQKNIEDLKNKLLTSDGRIDSSMKEQSETRREIMNLITNLEDVENQLKMAKDRNDKLLLKVGKLEILVRELKEELSKPPPSPPPTVIPEPKSQTLLEPPSHVNLQTPPPPAAPPPPPPPPTVVHVMTEEAKEQISTLEKQIQDYQIMLKELQDRIIMLENQVVQEQAKIKQLKMAVDQASNQSTLQPSVSPIAPATTPDIKMGIKLDFDIPAPKEHTSGEKKQFELSEASANYYKTLLSGMKKDLTQELDILKAHIQKEKTRTDAAVRRVENVHKDQIQTIQKDGLRLLRAVMHFRDQLVIALTKEGYLEPANQLQDLPKLIPDDFRVEVRSMLNNMTGNVVDYLHNIQTIMAHTFKSIRVLNKLGAAKPRDDRKIKQMKIIVTEIKDAKEESTGVAQRLKSNKQKIIDKEDEFKADHNEAKYLSLLSRYKLVWNMYKNLMKEMDILEIDFEDSLDENTEIVSSLCVSTIELKQAFEKQKIKISKIKNKKRRKDNSNKVKGESDDNLQNISKSERIGSDENLENIRKGGSKTEQDNMADDDKTEQENTDDDDSYNKRKSGEPNEINDTDSNLPDIQKDDTGVTDSNLPGGQKKQTKPKVARELEYKIRKRHLRRNQIILSEAMEDERISHDLYTKANNLLSDFKSHPIKRFQCLVQRYVTFKALQVWEENSKKLLGGDVYLPTDKRQVLQDLIQRQRQRLINDFIRGKEKWDQIEEETENQKKEIWDICDEVMAETGVQLIQPKVVRVQAEKSFIVPKTDKSVTLPKVDQPVNRKMLKLLKRRQRRRQRRLLMEKLELPPLLVGNNIRLKSKYDHNNWKRETPTRVVMPAMITTPLLLSLDVNTERIKARKSLMRMSRSEVRSEVRLAKTRSYDLAADWSINYINEVV